MISGNYGTNFHPQPGDHPDFIQFSKSYDTHAPSSGNTVQDNRYERGAGDPAQGLFDEDSQNLSVRRNVFLGTLVNAISFARTQGGDITGNFVQAYRDYGALIIVRQNATGVAVNDNVTPSVVIGTPTDGTLQPANMPRPSGNKSTTKATAPGDYAQVNTWLAAKGLPAWASGPLQLSAVAIAR